MDLILKYQNISHKMSAVNYQILWPKFHQYEIALYDDENVVYKGILLPKTKDFMANTAIKFDNQMIGIWWVQDDIDDDILTSKLIHETFHAFQIENNESRFPNEIDALIHYQYNVENLSLKMQENILIVKLIDEFDYKKFKRLMNLRNQRRIKFPYEFQYELAIEQIEGTANYIELESLKQLSFEKYDKKLESMKKSIINSKNLFPIRIVSYNIGALIIKILKDNKLRINDNFEDGYYLEKYFSDVSSNIEIENKLFSEIEKELNLYISETFEIINHSVNQNNLISKGTYDLLGVNVYNARFYNQFIYTTYFLMYKDNDKEIIINGDFVIKLNNQFKISEIYKVLI